MPIQPRIIKGGLSHSDALFLNEPLNGDNYLLLLQNAMIIQRSFIGYVLNNSKSITYNSIAFTVFILEYLMDIVFGKPSL